MLLKISIDLEYFNKYDATTIQPIVKMNQKLLSI